MASPIMCRVILVGKIYHRLKTSAASIAQQSLHPGLLDQYHQPSTPDERTGTIRPHTHYPISNTCLVRRDCGARAQRGEEEGEHPGALHKAAKSGSVRGRRAAPDRGLQPHTGMEARSRCSDQLPHYRTSPSSDQHDRFCQGEARDGSRCEKRGGLSLSDCSEQYSELRSYRWQRVNTNLGRAPCWHRRAVGLEPTSPCQG